MRASALLALDTASVFFDHALAAAAEGRPKTVVERLAANGRAFLEDFYWYSTNDEGEPPPVLRNRAIAAEWGPA